MEDNSVYPPAVAYIEGTYYQLNSFENRGDTFYQVEADDFADALNKSVSLYGVSTLNVVELAGLTSVCDKFDVDTTKIEAFTFHGIKGRKNFDTLMQINHFCPVLKRYLSIKSIPLKTIAVFDKLENDSRRYVKNSVDGKEPSVQEFRKLVNTLFDMKGKVESEDFDGDLLTNLSRKKNLSKISFMKEFDRMKEGFPLSITSSDLFETAKLDISFSVNNVEEFREKMKNALEKAEKIEDIYRFLDEQNIY